MNITRIKELEKCHNDFSYFASNYVKIIHPVRGLIGFDLLPYQKRLWETYDKERFVILRKWRQGGFTTMSCVWALFQCIFGLDQHIMIGCPRTGDATRIRDDVIKPILDWLPEWMRPQLGINNQHHIEFKETNCHLMFHNLEAARGRALNCLIIDEAAFHKNMERKWRAIYPCLSTGGKCFVVSTTNGINWFQETYQRACEKQNAFLPFQSDYWENPYWQDEKRNEEIRKSLGEKGWHQEVLANFLVDNDYEEQKESTTPL